MLINLHSLSLKLLNFLVIKYATERRSDKAIEIIIRPKIRIEKLILLNNREAPTHPNSKGYKKNQNHES